MNLKKAIIFTAILAAGSSAFAQSSNLKKAASNIQKFEELKATGSVKLGESFLKTAKEAIDAASVHEKTKDLAETWTYYSLVYSNLASNNKSEEDAIKATEGIKKAKELDKDGKQAANISVAEHGLYSYNFNLGVEHWDKQDFKAAYTAFDKALTAMPNDTTLTYYAGLAAIQDKNYQNGIAKYKQLIDRKDFSAHKTILVDLPKLYLSLQDTTNALEYAALAAKEYPTENDAVVQNIELNLITGNELKIITEIENQIAKDSNNKNLYYYLGIAQSAKGDSEKAYEAYKKAIEIDPNYSDAQTNAGVILMNTVREQLQDLNNNKTLSNNQYKEKIEELKNKIKPAEAHFSKVIELDPKSETALRGLKSLYDFLQDEAKANAVQAKIDAL